MPTGRASVTRSQSGPAWYLSALVLRMPGGDKAGIVVSRPCDFPSLILERGKQRCFASFIRNACRCIYARDDDCVPETSPCKLFCSAMDPQGWLLKPRLATFSLPFLALVLLHACTLSLSHTYIHTQCVSTHTPLFFFPFGFLSLYCFKLVAGLIASLNFICLSSPPPPPLPPSSSSPPSPEVILFTFSAAFSMSLCALQGI